MDYKASTQTNVKVKNQRIILQLLINEGPMTRADLAKKMKSSKPTVSKNVEELLQDSKILEVGKDDNMVGKKGTLLDINGDYGYVLAIDMSKSHFRVVIADMKEQWRHTEKTALDLPYIEKEGFEGAVLTFLKDFLQQAPIPVAAIRQVAIAYSGVVGHNDDLYLTNMKYKETLLNRLIPYIKEELGLPLTIKNDVNLAVIAEKKYGKYGDADNLYLLSADTGVGVGIIIHNRLYEGDRNAAGEVGFVLPVQHKDGRYYTIEERVSLHALAERYRKVKGPQATYDDLRTAVAGGEAEAQAIYEDVLEDLAVTITNIASILDMKRVVVTGRLFDLKGTIIDDLNRRIAAMNPFETVIHQSTLGKISLRGAVAVGVEAIITSLV